MESAREKRSLGCVSGSGKRETEAGAGTVLGQSVTHLVCLCGKQMWRGRGQGLSCVKKSGGGVRGPGAPEQSFPF